MDYWLGKRASVHGQQTAGTRQTDRPEVRLWFRFWQENGFMPPAQVSGRIKHLPTQPPAYAMHSPGRSVHRQ